MVFRDFIPAQQRASTGDAVDGAGAAPEGSASSAKPPGVSGDIARPNYVGPSGNGLVERMNAGESPLNQGRSVKAAPVRFQKAVPGSKENAAVGRREARWSALWAGSSLPLEGQAMPQGRPMGAAFRAREFRRSATLFLRLRRVRNRQLERKPAGMCRAATLLHTTTNVRRRK
jgi:hypothetical protein